MKPKIVVTLVVLMALLLITGVARALEMSPSAPARAATPYYSDQPAAVAAAIDWLIRTHQNADGGYTSFSSGADQQPSTIAGTLDTLIALSSSGIDPTVPWPGRQTTPIAYLLSQIDEVADYAGQNGGNAGKLLLTLTAANQNPRAFGGHNFVISATQHLSPTGQYNVPDPYNQSLALLGLAAAAEPIPDVAVQWLKDRQAGGGDNDGSWDDGYGTLGNADASGMAVMALLAAKVPANDDTLLRATAFFARAQLPTGGFAYAAGLPENANSTALVLQALSALGENFYLDGGPWDAGMGTPLSALLSYQAKTGAFQSDFGFGPFDDFYATVQAIPGATGRPFPLPSRYQAARAGLDCLATLQDAGTGGWEQFAGFGINAAGTSRAIQAIVAAGDDPAAYTPGGITPLQALANLTPDYLSGGRGGRVGIVMQGVVAAGGDVFDFAGYNLPLSLTAYLSPTGAYDDTTFGIFAHAEAILGLAAAGQLVDPTAIAFLRAAQTGGDWGSVGDNGIALNALGQLVYPAPGLALSVLAQTQVADGGWGYGDIADSSASAEVAQGLAALGQHPFGPTWSQVSEGRLRHAADAIMARQAPGGCWLDYLGQTDDPFGTTDAIILLSTRPLPRFFVYLPATQPAAAAEPTP